MMQAANQQASPQKRKPNNSNRVPRAWNLAQEWLNWLDTRRFFAPPEKISILGRMSGHSGSGNQPNGPMSAEMAAFHLAVVSLEYRTFRAFVQIYANYPALNKTCAAELNVTEMGLYTIADTAAREVLKTMHHLVLMHEQMRAETTWLPT